MARYFSSWKTYLQETPPCVCMPKHTHTHTYTHTHTHPTLTHTHTHAHTHHTHCSVTHTQPPPPHTHTHTHKTHIPPHTHSVTHLKFHGSVGECLLHCLGLLGLGTALHVREGKLLLQIMHLRGQTVQVEVL